MKFTDLRRGIRFQLVGSSQIWTVLQLAHKHNGVPLPNARRNKWLCHDGESVHLLCFSESDMHAYELIACESK